MPPARWGKFYPHTRKVTRCYFVEVRDSVDCWMIETLPEVIATDTSFARRRGGRRHIFRGVSTSSTGCRIATEI